MEQARSHRLQRRVIPANMMLTLSDSATQATSVSLAVADSSGRVTSQMGALYIRQQTVAMCKLHVLAAYTWNQSRGAPVWHKTEEGTLHLHAANVGDAAVAWQQR